MDPKHSVIKGLYSITCFNIEFTESKAIFFNKSGRLKLIVKAPFTTAADDNLTTFFLIFQKNKV